MKPKKQACSERVYANDRSVIGRACSLPGIVLADGKWWCNKHSPEGKERREAARHARYEAWVEQSRAKAREYSERERRLNAYPILSAALEEIVSASDLKHARLIARRALSKVQTGDGS